jgi:anaerobic magnesium-protoporphyrin IX monomethyl ester cyclase
VKSIVLVNPPYSFWSERHNSLRPLIGNLPSIGLLSLAAVLRGKGYAVRILESAAWGLTVRQTVEEILREKPDFVGISCTTAAVHHAAQIAHGVKAALPETRVFVGGPHITALPEETFRCYRSFDFGIIGEGEEAFPELLEILEGGGDLRKAPGAIFRHGPQIVINPRGRAMEDLDRLPFPAFDLLRNFPQNYRPPFLNYLRGPCAPLATSRGCPQNCTFCDRSVFGNRYRRFSVGYLVDLLAYLKRGFQINHLVFVDDQFCGAKGDLLEFCEGLLRKNLQFHWNCDARVDRVDGEILNWMKRAGCWMVSYGIESGSQDILDRMQKGIRLEQAEEAVRRTKEAGIRAKGLFMVAHPEETFETLEKTLAFILRIPLDEVNLSILTPYPGTAIYRELKENSKLVEDWPRMNGMNLLHRLKGLSATNLEKYYRRILRKFYMQPRVTLSYLGLLLQSPENGVRILASGSQWISSRLYGAGDS